MVIMNKVNGLLVFLLVMVSFLANAQSKSEAKMGEKQFKMLKLTYGFYDNPELLGVVVEVGQNLEKHLDLDYKLQYHLLDMEEPNAFATSGGYVYVTRGLLALINTKDELAGILGHELTHVTQHHNSKTMYANIIPTILEIPGNIIGLLTSQEVANLLNFPIEVVTGSGTASFSRKLESNADKIGIEVAAKAGYDPYALGDILTRLNEFVEYLTKEEMKKSIFIDHPITPKRVKRINAQNKKNGFELQDTYPGTSIVEINNLIFGQNPTGGVLNDTSFIHPELSFYCDFPKSWIVNNSHQSITALAQNKQAVIMITAEQSMYIDDLVKNEVDKHKACKVLEKGEIEINGLKAFKLVLNTLESNKENKRLEVLWVKLEGKDVLIKAQAVAKINDFPKEKVRQFFKSIRMTTTDDFKEFTFKTIELKQVADSTIEATGDLSELSKIINGVKPGKNIHANRYIKEVKKHQLIEFD